MKEKRPYILTIAGFDPCGGAGLLADIKTFEANKTLGLAVSTCITYQNENEFEHVDWLSVEQIIKQIDILFKAYRINYAKIGLIENFEALDKIVDHLLSLNPSIKIIWDPIFSSSTGFDFHTTIKKEYIENICKKIFLITPNWVEMQMIYPELTILEGAKKISNFCNVFLKGGHNADFKGKDYLFTKTKQQNYRPKRIAEYPKHGSGCVLSAAITANHARGFSLERACLRAKEYVTYFLCSNESLLGYHKL
jgi:hydroxymethylpyrimidine/phosphomethylpyrimidine kinase